VAKPSLGFGAEVDRLVHKSPTLTAQLAAAEKMGFRVVPVELGKGNWMAPATKEICIEKGKPIADIVASIAHEVGHATHVVNGHTPSLKSEHEYIESRAWDEGGATLNEYIVRDELRKNGENFSPKSMAKDEKLFASIYAAFLQNHDVDKAKVAMGELYKCWMVCPSDLGSNIGQPEPYIDAWIKGYAHIQVQLKVIEQNNKAQ
jgi:hypothetical protein